MAIYRSDQAVFSFASEAALGAMPQRETVAASDDAQVASGDALTAAANAGDTTIYVTEAGGLYPATNPLGKGSYIIFNVTEADKTHGPYEIRRVLRRIATSGAADTLELSAPLGFNHAVGCPISFIDEAKYGDVSNVDVQPHSLLLSGDGTHKTPELISWIPGIYETIDTPDVEESYEPRYMLGSATKRNPFTFLRQQQNYTGSVAGVTLLNGWALKYAFGEVESNGATNNTNADIDIGSGTWTHANCNKGDVWVHIHGTAAMDIPNGTYLQFTPTANGIVEGRTIRKIVQGGSATYSGNGYVRVNYPMPFALTDTNTAAAATVQTLNLGGDAPTQIMHTMREDVVLPSFTWNVNVIDSDGAASFQRRYYGGKLDSLTMSGEEGGLLVMDWDSATFLGMVHNQSDAYLAATPMERYHPMSSVTPTKVGVPEDDEAGGILPTTQPYYFHEGVMTFFGSTIARVRSFSISVSNSLEPKFYMKENIEGGGERGPTDIFEGPRDYSMTATISLEDSLTGSGINNETMFKQMIKQSTVGFAITMEFRRAGSTGDFIRFTIPNDGVANEGIGTQGAFINSAPVNIDGSNPLEQNISMVFPSMKVEVSDHEPFYP